MNTPPAVSRPVQLWDMVDGPMPRGVLGLGDPDVHVIDGVATMFLGGFSTSFRNRLYVATLEAGCDPAGPSWNLAADARGRALAITPDPPRGAWDAAGMHTPSYVPSTADQPARIYYTGRRSAKQYGPSSEYAIGALELLDGGWRRREQPVIRGDGRRRSVLEPLVVHDGDRYLMWFQANPFEIGPGDLPDYEIRVAESADGASWSDPRVFTTSSEGFFDNALTRVPGGWLMVLARGADIHGSGGMPPQGLWTSTAPELSMDPDSWSAPRHVLRTDAPGMPEHLARGTYGPGVLRTVDPDRVTLYATGVRAAPRWPRLIGSRLLHGHSPVVPSPFYLSVAALDLHVETRTGDQRHSAH
ncbi:hypothetical protein [Brachybacterium sacelli]|uniref:Uncharacterized protein n=1 Tax=Brachybacterium sacelli TaxID=173364 RepID=A0ABS4X2X4_9MICO|nr:hypothetical protein [Brachybacterium sacelli]MBP2382711.1 hypothetical protein [Brachybacterium sacelli]